MLDMRSATRIGAPMRGDLRYGAPPESISISTKKSGSSVVKIVSFDENFVKGDSSSKAAASVSSKSIDDSNELLESFEFNPEQCEATPSWDVWSFGLIMGQLVLGQSMVLLPNFEKASDAHLKKLYKYDDKALQVSTMKILGM